MENYKLGIYVVSTLKHSYAMMAQARALHSACVYANQENPTIVIVSSDDAFFDKIKKEYQRLFSSAEIFLIKKKEFFDCIKRENYKKPIQLMIAQMRTLATNKLLSEGCDKILSVDSDVLPKHNSIQCMLDMLNFDHGYYDVVQCPYPSQGGGSFLGGRGTLQRQIAEDFTEDERDIPKELKEDLKNAEKDLKLFVKQLEKEKVVVNDKTNKEIEEKHKKIADIRKTIEGCPPKNNVFALNGKKWKKRGWFDFAYPAIGKGAIVPVDWVGFGCTMMTKKAAILCDWTGYDGSGTEDLYIIWNRWYQHDINIANIAHCPSDHIVRDKGKENKYIHIKTFHEKEGEFVWHLRQEFKPWYSQDIGEEYSEENNGQHTPIIEENNE